MRIIIGDLDSSAILERESVAADIVCRQFSLFCLFRLTNSTSDWANADHEGAAKSIIKGLSNHSMERPGLLIHTSGTGILGSHHLTNKIQFGDSSDKVFNDWDGIKEVTSLPDSAPHRNVDKSCLPPAWTTLLSKPPSYVLQQYTVREEVQQINEAIGFQNWLRRLCSRAKAYKLVKGKRTGPFVNVHDLSQLYLRLVEEAVKGGGGATWGSPEGYYFAESEDNMWGDVARDIAKLALTKGYIKDQSVRSIGVDEANQMCAHSGYLWGTNSRSQALRARKILGWSPVSPSLKEELPNALDIEAKALGL